MRFVHTIFPLIAASLAGILGVVHAELEVHDETFVPDAILRVSEAEVKQSCIDAREILVVNGTSPGPEIRLVEGKSFWIRVYNDLKHENLTMHWHGLTMAVAPFSDGTPAASQWPFPPGTFYDYLINTPVGSAGTYFYHSHVGLQAIACTGPLSVVEAEDPPYDYEDDRWLFLTDVFTDNDTYIEQGLTSVPQFYHGDQKMVLVNGKGGGTHDDGIVCHDELSVIYVEPGKTYRFRVVGATTVSFNSMAIDGHPNLQVIEADASYTEIHNTSFLQIAAGQRFSFLLDTLAKPEKEYYYMQLETRERDTLTRSYVAIHYGTPLEDFFGFPDPVYPPAQPIMKLPDLDTSFLDYQLRPLANNNTNPIYSTSDFPTADQVTRRVNITVHLSNVDGKITYHMNNYTWNEGIPKEPYLVSLYKNDGIEFPSMERALANDGLDPLSDAYPSEMDEVLEVVVQSTASDRGSLETHPWHVHGEHVWDIGSGKGTYDRAANEAKWANSTGKPVRRDTMVSYRFVSRAKPWEIASWRAWRVRVKQPGVWMVHCHILPHMIFGMQTVWVMGNSSEVLGRVPALEVQGYLEPGGSVVGTDDHWPEVVKADTYTMWSNNEQKSE